MALLLFILVILAIDLGIKESIEDVDPAQFPKELEGSKGKIMLYRNHNDGFSFGALRKRPELVKMIPMAVLSAVAGVFFWIYPKKGLWAEKIAASMILGGGLSNFYDRMKRGYVVDYFSIQWKTLKKVVFNLGDIFIILGTVVMLVGELVESMRER